MDWKICLYIAAGVLVLAALIVLLSIRRKRKKNMMTVIHTKKMKALDELISNKQNPNNRK